MAKPSEPDIHALQMEEWTEEEATNVTAITAEAKQVLAAQRSLNACFVVLSGANQGEAYLLKEAETVIGRSMQATLRLNDEGVSRRHARVVRRGESLILEDLGSANGTFVNEEPVLTHALQEGDKVRLGSNTVLKFAYHDELDVQFQQQMYDAALRDGLTRAYNKKYVLDRLGAELAYAVRHESLLSILMFDVDHFKSINDRHGHLAGDFVLMRLAGAVGDTLRTEDIFGRYGGEEFLVICRGIRSSNAVALGERLRALVEGTSFDYEGTVIPVTMSVGVATFPDVKVKTIDELVSAADEALYTSKRSGRNRVTLKAP